MSNTHEIVILGASHANDNGVPLIQAVLPIGNDAEDVEPFGEIDSFQCLGVSSLPWPKDENGHAEGYLVRNVANRDAILVGARDTRTAAIVGKLKPGDVVLHSTGPQQAAQVQCKEEKRQVVAATKDSGGKTMALVLDGKNDKVQIAACGHMFEMSRDGGISLVDSSGKAGILIKDGRVSIFGQVVLGGMQPNPTMSILMGPPVGLGLGPVAVPTIGAMGVFIGQ